MWFSCSNITEWTKLQLRVYVFMCVCSEVNTLFLGNKLWLCWMWDNNIMRPSFCCDVGSRLVTHKDSAAHIQSDSMCLFVCFLWFYIFNSPHPHWMDVQWHSSEKRSILWTFSGKNCLRIWYKCKDKGLEILLQSHRNCYSEEKTNQHNLSFILTILIAQYNFKGKYYH